MNDLFVSSKVAFALPHVTFRQPSPGLLLAQGGDARLSLCCYPMMLLPGVADVFDQHLGDGWIEANRDGCLVVEAETQSHPAVAASAGKALQRWCADALGMGWRVWLVCLHDVDPVVEIVLGEADLWFAGHAFPLTLLLHWPEDKPVCGCLSFPNFPTEDAA
jgi:hypothetical protein